MKPTICILGLGYVGLPTAAVAAASGIDVHGVDINPGIVETINHQRIHIEEPGLEALVQSAVQAGRLRAAAEPVPADAFLIAVPTPIHEDKTPNLDYIDSAVRMIARVIKPGNLVILESTIPPRTCLGRVAPLIQQLTGLRYQEDYFLAHCPERVIPGKALEEIVCNDRVVGGATPQAAELAAQLYANFVTGQIMKTDVTTAEMIKLMENTFRDVNIALANEFASIADDLGVDVQEAIRLANFHPRVNIHSPGIGVGGHCLPVVPWFIAYAAPQKAKIIRAAREINDARPGQIAARMIKALEQNPGRSLAVFGLSFKPDIDDLSGAPAIEIVRQVAQAITGEILVVEPYAGKLPAPLASLPNVRLVSVEEALRAGGINVRLVNHRLFADLPLTDYHKLPL